MNLLVASLATLLLAADAAPPAPVAPAPVEPVALVPFASSESWARLGRSNHKIDFFRLANHFESQANGGMCGPTTGVIVLNALRVDRKDIAKPKDTSSVPAEARGLIPKQFDPFFSRYTQGTFFDDKFTAVKPREVFMGAPPAPGAKLNPGLQLRELGDILKGHGLDVQVRVLDDKLPDATAKKEIVENLGREGDFVVVNYARAPLGQKGGGHISPLAAWDETTDSFLVLDVNANDGKTWVWVPAATLLGAMRTPDQRENRGFLLVREGLPPARP